MCTQIAHTTYVIISTKTPGYQYRFGLEVSTCNPSAKLQWRPRGLWSQTASFKSLVASEKTLGSADGVAIGINQRAIEVKVTLGGKEGSPLRGPGWRLGNCWSPGTGCTAGAAARCGPGRSWGRCAPPGGCRSRGAPAPAAAISPAPPSTIPGGRSGGWAMGMRWGGGGGGGCEGGRGGEGGRNRRSSGESESKPKLVKSAGVDAQDSSIMWFYVYIWL